MWLPQDKVVSLLLSNYLLWPVTNHIMSKFVPKQHRAGATHVVTVCAQRASWCHDKDWEQLLWSSTRVHYGIWGFHHVCGHHVCGAQWLAV